MEQLDDYKVRLLLVCLVTVIVSCGIGGNANADFVVGTPVNLGPIVNTSDQCGHPSISHDGLSLYFTSLRPGGSGGYGDFWVTTRETVLDPWGPPVCLGQVVNSPHEDTAPEISSDGLSLYFSSDRFPGRPVGYGVDLWVTRRETLDDPWGPPVNLGQIINSTDTEQNPSISTDGLSLYFSPWPVGGGDLYVSTRNSVLDNWGTPVSLGPTVNHPSAYDHAPDISADGLCLFFSSDRSGGYGGRDLWVTMRDTENDPWREPFNLGPMVNSADHETTPDISSDGSTLYFCSDRLGGFGSLDLWEAPILPIVDFNGDGIVDAADMCIMIDYWGIDNQLCDIGPMPWGDGIVDVQDLIVIAGYLKSVLIAHYKLDEMAGDVAYDSSINNHDATVYGEPVWQPTGGKFAGALEFDGIDDYLSTPFILNPAKSSLSAFSWIKGGEPGQSILSQRGYFGGTWLSIDPSEGTFMTGFSAMYLGELISEKLITDDQWHHVGLVYDKDSLQRRLYVDGVQVAEDEKVVSGMPSDDGMYIGASKDLDAGSFFFGLIDDVHIYNKALTTDEIAALAQ